MILHKLKQWANPVTTRLPNGDQDCSFFDSSFSALRLAIFSVILLRSPLWHSVDGEKWVSPVGQIWNSHPQIQRSVIVKRWLGTWGAGLLPGSFQQHGYSIAKVKTIESGSSAILSQGLVEPFLSTVRRVKQVWQDTALLEVSWFYSLIVSMLKFISFSEWFAELFILSLMFNIVLNNEYLEYPKLRNFLPTWN